MRFEKYILEFEAPDGLKFYFADKSYNLRIENTTLDINEALIHTSKGSIGLKINEIINSLEHRIKSVEYAKFELNGNKYKWADVKINRTLVTLSPINSTLMWPKDG